MPDGKKVKLAFAYDSQHRRIRKQVWRQAPASPYAWELKQDRRYYWQGWNLLAEAEAFSGSPCSLFSWELVF